MEKLFGILQVIVFLVLVLAVALTFRPFLPESLVSWLPEEIPSLPALAISGTTLIAISAFQRDRNKTAIQRQRERSQFFLTEATRGLDEVVDLLRDQNNNRLTWIRAARTLLAARHLAHRIEDPEYAEAYRLRELRTRNDLYVALTVVDEKTGRRDPLPPHFFFGLPNWRTDTRNLDDVAIDGSSESEAGQIVIDRVFTHCSNPRLQMESVVAIFDFLAYPKDYQDPLHDVSVWDAKNTWESSMLENQGAIRYIAHRQCFDVVNGKIYPIPSDDSGSE